MPLLDVQNVAKRYGSVVALKSAELVVEPGEIHALLGANGAGKSTLVKILTGVIRHDSGTIAINGEQVRVGSPERAAKVGLAPVFQDPALLPDLTVAQNLKLTRTPIKAVREWLERMELTVDLTEMTSDLPLPTLRMLDLARALARDPQLLMLDEITAALPSDLAEKVFAVMREWRGRGRSVLFITHRLAEVTALCDRASVLRDGRTVGTLVPKPGEEEKIVELMLGESRSKLAQAIDAAVGESDTPAVEVAATAGETQLEVRNLVVGDDPNGISFTLRAGEILGVAALEGQGQDLLFDYLAGERRPSGGGEMLVGGQSFSPHHPYEAIRKGVVLVPADRVLALLPQRPIRENIAAPLFNRISRWGPINRGDESRRVQNAIERLSIDARAQRQARRLSGGNQQKLTIARWLAAGFTTMLCFDPTRGIDVGSQAADLRAPAGALRGGRRGPALHVGAARIQLVCDRTIVVSHGAVTAGCPVRGRQAALLKAAHGLTRRRRRHEHGRQQQPRQGPRTGLGPLLRATAGRSVSTSSPAARDRGMCGARAGRSSRRSTYKTMSPRRAAAGLRGDGPARDRHLGGIDLSLGVIVEIVNVSAASLIETELRHVDPHRLQPDRVRRPPRDDQRRADRVTSVPDIVVTPARCPSSGRNDLLIMRHQRQRAVRVPGATTACFFSRRSRGGR